MDHAGPASRIGIAHPGRRSRTGWTSSSGWPTTAASRWCAQDEACLFTARRARALTAIALLRTAPAFDFLMAEIREGSHATAGAVIEALAIHAPDDLPRERAMEAARQRGDRSLERQARESL